MDYQCKIVSYSPGRKSHLVDLQVEILRPGGGRFAPPKVVTAEVAVNADADDIQDAVIRAMKGEISFDEMVGETFNLRRGR